MLARHACDRRLNGAIDQWAFCRFKPGSVDAISATNSELPEASTNKNSEPSATGSSNTSTVATDPRQLQRAHRARAHRQPDLPNTCCLTRGHPGVLYGRYAGRLEPAGDWLAVAGRERSS